jgi:hypothetical protein
MLSTFRRAGQETIVMITSRALGVDRSAQIDWAGWLRFCVIVWPLSLLAIWLLVLVTFLLTDPNLSKPSFRYIQRSLSGPQGSETVMRVKRLPDMPALRGPSGRHFNLGYHWTAEGVGRWVGYATYDKSSYAMISGEQIFHMLEAAGVGALPLVPQRPVDRSF